MLHGKRILLIVSGGIAAYKSLELVRRLRERGAAVRCVLTRGGSQFVTPLSLAALSEDKVYTELFSLTDEAEMGHIQLSRDADLLVVAPATADILAKMTHGQADDLASTVLLATDKDVMVAPAMNVRMWEHAATQANLETLRQRGVHVVGPEEGDMACGEYGLGRLSEPDDIAAAVSDFFQSSAPLSGRRALVTSGPTHEPIDPVRYIANRSSGRQGHAIAAALASRGATTTLVSGPTNLPDPPGVTVVRVESARDMLAACEAALPADVAVCAAAVADWRVAREANEKLKKNGAGPPSLEMAENPDILATLAAATNTRPRLVIGFAAETEQVVEHARTKRDRKGCDWILANDVSPETGTFGGEDNTIHLVSADGDEDWPRMSKADVANRLADRIAANLEASE
ncbi:MAG: bifunctional phosphopantothenoylcysteine decarboxylase/phosphopantothenate--cysteine ligase CoaBC [Rhodospirillaceae bacterium]|jgi:phosphopantothenoylcysteine decarboxylase/phosphopantothenate--cysteine ligase|nr:bifunctional phosphopantothenoylcysteine decarboxylase/phosphopantothenate--cysteine ligase CoaBC [Rhodospirillaceae bacterium]MBT3809905.1 bifunctional phosphopantothenoylcysteine decarboxylase/phosphopantothenate--cysteine ligase CoaBC [Rhodospirillaceae bacterium]MBT4772834.1 bifunctional phosphopantothenoylcysteine decarboxylase/phosphopantothenate--cysteine ligase CoaBC [Rhodospirillaceae bacterium]MBT5360083.1 bifunctional phosphopantothenoylcysteine decarboxylase/phosphopantothenate--c